MLRESAGDRPARDPFTDGMLGPGAERLLFETAALMLALIHTHTTHWTAHGDAYVMLCYVSLSVYGALSLRESSATEAHTHARKSRLRVSCAALTPLFLYDRSGGEVTSRTTRAPYTFLGDSPSVTCSALFFWICVLKNLRNWTTVMYVRIRVETLTICF